MWEQRTCDRYFCMCDRPSHTLKPRDFLRPRAFSNLRPLERTWGAVLELGTPGALAKWRAKGELVKCEALASCLENACPRCLREAQSADRELGYIKEALVISDCA